MATIKNFPNNRDEYINCEPVMKWLHGRTSGVFGADEGLAVSANDNMTVSVSDGPGWLSNAAGDGCVIWNDTEETTGSKLTLEVGIADPSRPRIDRVVASWDTVDYTALPTIEILQGSPASNPQPPALTNTTLKRQISLAQYRVAAAATKITASDITDERLDPDVCGLVTESVAVDTSVMQAQFEALLQLVKDELDNLNAGTEAMTKTMYDPEKKGAYLTSDQRIFDLVYPVGSIYMSLNYVNPGEIFGGTWEAIEGRFLLGANATQQIGGYPAGTTGGEATHTLSKAELPDYSLPVSSGENVLYSKGSGDPAAYVQTSASGWGLPNWSATNVQVSSGGSGQAHNNMPPYLAVHIWQRTA